MGMALVVMVFLFIGGLVLLAWTSINALCGCFPLWPGAVEGVMGLSLVIGCVLGGVGELLWG